ncbi:MAG: protein-glutamate O-methyltransferase CheR [Pseudorhodoplanes sp.]
MGMVRTALDAVPARTMDEAEPADSSREFVFSDADFRSLVQLAHDYAGISLGDNKRNLVYTRVSRRLRALGLKTFRDYRNHLGAHQDELESFINAISTNLTRFFRESHHFDHFRASVVIPYGARRGGRFRIWSAGCSTGEEPYTIAAVIRREIENPSGRDLRVLATDIDTDVLGKAARGEYPLRGMDDVPGPYRDFFVRGGRDAGTILVSDDLRSLISFRHLNLISHWPFRGKFDAIFCRNVMIYFGAATRSDLIARFTAALNPGGWLYIGHSESLLGSHPDLQLVGRTIYRRKG